MAAIILDGNTRERQGYGDRAGLAESEIFEADDKKNAIKLTERYYECKIVSCRSLRVGCDARFFRVAFAQELKPIQLPKPQMDGGKPLMQSLKERKTSRAFSSEKLPEPVLANLLWAAFGINRPESGHRTAPSAMNRQEIDVYVATADGLYLYDAKTNALQPVLAGDIRAGTGRQPFVTNAPVNLVLVADYARMGSRVPEEERLGWASVSAGCISQNVYLFCASDGLATVVRGSVDKPALAKTMKLRPDQKIILAQTVGYPKK